MLPRMIHVFLSMVCPYRVRLFLFFIVFLPVPFPDWLVDDRWSSFTSSLSSHMPPHASHTSRMAPLGCASFLILSFRRNVEHRGQPIAARWSMPPWAEPLFLIVTIFPRSLPLQNGPRHRRSRRTRLRQSPRRPPPPRQSPRPPPLRHLPPMRSSF